MRRAVGRACLACAACATAGAHASPDTTVTAEAGAEGDTNVQRVETGPSSAARIGAGAARVGAKVDDRGKLATGAYALQLSALARLVGNSDIRSENVALLAGDVRWLHPIGERPVAVGAGITAADALSLTSQTGARTFANLGADALLSLRDGENRALTIGAGARLFRYKPDPPRARGSISRCGSPPAALAVSSSPRRSASRRARTRAPRSPARARPMRHRAPTASPARRCPAAIAIIAPASRSRGSAA